MYQNLYLVLTGRFRRYDVGGNGVKGPALALYETGDRDVETVTGMVVPLESKGVKGQRGVSCSLPMVYEGG